MAQRFRMRPSWNSSAMFSKPVLRTLMRLMPSSSRLIPSTAFTSVGTSIFLGVAFDEDHALGEQQIASHRVEIALYAANLSRIKSS